MVPILRLYAKYKSKDEKFKNREFLAHNLLKKYKSENINTNNSDGKKKIWFHSASMGEFEQARPIIERLKSTHPEIQIIVTFFSPSGYDNRKNYEYADFISYLPLDFPEKVSNFLDIIKPDMAIFIRYEIWFNYLNQLKQRNIPTFLLNATKPQSKLINVYYRTCYRLFNKIYVMNNMDMPYFEAIIGRENVQLLPDTRFDRIAAKVEDSINKPFIDKVLFQDSKVFVAGSTWMEDEDLILAAFKGYKTNNNNDNNNNNKLALIIVPHEPFPEHIAELIRKWDNHVLLSKLNDLDEASWAEIRSGEKIIIVDSIGKLLQLYANAHIAYIGGAFGDGVHSVTEPAGYGLPLITGKDISKSPDAIELNKLGGLCRVSNFEELLQQINKLMNDGEYYNSVAKISAEFVRTRLGSTEIFINDIVKYYS